MVTNGDAHRVTVAMQANAMLATARCKNVFQSWGAAVLGVVTIRALLVTK